MILSQIDNNNSCNDDMGPSVSMAIYAKDNDQFLKESYNLRRTSSLKHSRKPQWHQCDTGSSEASSNQQYMSKDILTVKDDGSVPLQRTEYVDYLTYQWNDFEIINSWKFIKLKKCNNNNNNLLYNRRLENMSWRIYYRLKSQRCNFVTKFDDFIWLYGPLIHRDKSISHTTILCNNNNTAKPLKLKPILKKRNLRETLVKDSLWKLKETKYKKQRSNEGSNSNINTLAVLSQFSLNSNEHNQSNSRHIRFNSKVQQCIATLQDSHNNIKILPSVQLNYDDSNDSCSSDTDNNNNNNIDDNDNDNDNDPVIIKNYAISHNVTTQRRYPYIYDYNSVYTGDVTQFIPQDNTCDIIDLPQDIDLNLRMITPPENSPLSTPQTPISSTFGNTSSISSHTETSSIQTKTRDFITGQLISRPDENLLDNTPPPILFNSHK